MRFDGSSCFHSTGARDFTPSRSTTAPLVSSFFSLSLALDSPAHEQQASIPKPSVISQETCFIAHSSQMGRDRLAGRFLLVN